ncbi:hypothetical protein MNBD_BACTEROID04-1770 [hydrothermal vent metagenome]|uniref:Uncharacterized protein n=1 Tax=hydrothermal vent metagenome TaxID=652676 RepID=A0A3B0UBT6_9ZZZZ
MGENEFTSTAILNFHHSENGNKGQSVLMKRSYVETVSITSVKKQSDLIEMLYEDVVCNQKSIYKSIAPNLLGSCASVKRRIK